MAENISKKYYNIMFPSNKIKQLETLYSGITDKITIGSIKGKCHNKDNIKDAPDYQVVYYEEDGKTYCLLIDDLLSQINNADGFEDVLNPETGNTIRQEFIERFYDIYGNTIREDGYEERTIEKIEEPKKEEVPKEQELAPGLVSIMLENIRKCQVETLTWGDSDDENVPEKCTSIVDDNDNLSDASSVSSLSISELDEEIFGKQSDFNSADSDSDNSSISTGDNSSGKDSDNSSISTGDKHSSMSSNNDDSPHCKVCNKRCLEQIRTIREEPKGTFLPENYCSIVCLEEEEFKKAKKTDKSEQFAAREARKDAKSSSSKDEQ
jgi:hypothetical protein